MKTTGGYLYVSFEVVTGNSDLIYLMAASVSFGKSSSTMLLSSSDAALKTQYSLNTFETVKQCYWCWVLQSRFVISKIMKQIVNL